MHRLQSPTMPNCSPIRYKREIHLPSVESILHCETDARYRYMPSYRPSKVFRYQPYPQCRQRYVTMDENLKVISDRYEDDFRVIFGPYILYPIHEEMLARAAERPPPPPGRIRRWANWLLARVFP